MVSKLPPQFLERMIRAMDKTVKGTHAQFLRQDPRYINEPICILVTGDDELVKSGVAHCMRWDHSTDRAALARQNCPYSSSTTSRADYSAHPVTVNARKDHQPKSTINTAIQPELYLAPDKTAVKEWMSFEHKYNCRIDPNLPAKGKRHGTIVLKDTTI